MNREDSVIKGIDALIDASLARGPVDDYNANYYPKCLNCDCDWHGIQCSDCDCTNCDGEVAVHRPPALPYYRRQRIPLWVASHVLSDYLGHRERPRVRFWQHNEEDNQLRMLEGVAEVMQIDWANDGCSVRLRLDPCQEMVIDDPDACRAVAPAGPLVPGMISMEGFRTEDAGARSNFTPIGFLSPDDLSIERTIEPDVVQWGGDVVVRAAQDYCETTIRIDDAPGLIEMLEGRDAGE